jgi:predicted ATPase
VARGSAFPLRRSLLFLGVEFCFDFVVRDSENSVQEISKPSVLTRLILGGRFWVSRHRWEAIPFLAVVYHAAERWHMLETKERVIILPTNDLNLSNQSLQRMISSLHIRGYRGFAEFEMSGLERVNLLVGTNNSGKTSVLEAINLLTSRGEPWALWEVLQRRGERLATVERDVNRPPELDVSHLFTGHDIQLGSNFTVGAKNQTPERRITVTVGEIKEQTADGALRKNIVPSRIGLHIKGQPAPLLSVIPLSRSFGMYSDVLEVPRRLRRRSAEDDVEMPVQFITTDSLQGSELVSLWDKVALTPNESRVLLALRFLGEDIERIAAQAGAQNYYGRGGFIVKIKGRDHPLPIGSMGDGMWRMMAMAIAIAHCKGGVLLVDEIDTGLHYTVMANMWRLIFGAAKELDVQVFATTHSSDCIKSLAELCYAETDVSENVTLQRIERGKTKSVPYTAREIEISAERQVEVR